MHTYAKEVPDWIITIKPAIIICESKKLSEIDDELFPPLFYHQDAGKRIVPYGALTT
jgi:hypothetical protein